MASAEREYPLSAKRNCSRRPRRPRGPRGSRQKTLYEADNRPVPAVIVEPVPVIPGTIFNVFGYSLSAFGGCGCTTSCVMSYLGYGPAAPCLHGTRTDSATNTEDSESDTADSDSLVEIEDTTISPSPNKYLFTPPAPPTSRLQGRRGRRYRHVPHTPDIFRELKGIKAIGQRGPTPNIPTSPGATTAPVCNNSKPPALNTSNDNSSPEGAAPAWCEQRPRVGGTCGALCPPGVGPPPQHMKRYGEGLHAGQPSRHHSTKQSLL